MEPVGGAEGFRQLTGLLHATLSRRAKVLMLVQSAVSLLTMVLVISRAVGIFK